MAATDYAQLAEIYDLIVAFEDDIPFFAQEARKANGPVLELMSGTGRVSIPLAENGIELTCIDSSKEMLAALQKKAEEKRLPIQIAQQDIADLKLADKFDLIFIPYNSFHELAERDSRAKALAAIRSHLKDEGRFICTLHNPRIRLRAIGIKQIISRPLPTLGEGWSVEAAIDTKFDESDGIAQGTQTFEIRDSKGEIRKRLELPLRFALLEKEEFESSAALHGFIVESLFGDYSRNEFSPDESPYMIWVLRKRESIAKDAKD